MNWFAQIGISPSNWYSNCSILETGTFSVTNSMLLRFISTEKLIATKQKKIFSIFRKSLAANDSGINVGRRSDQSKF